MEFSEVLMDHIESPRNVGWIENSDAAAATGAPGRPPFMSMSFRLAGGIVREVRYRTFGCGPAIAAGSALTEMLRGRTVNQCLEITEEQLAAVLCGMPHDKRWCLALALTTMRKALESIS